MPAHEIPNAFLIRALARRPSAHCEGCGGRMFVKTLTGKCPHCYAGYPPRLLQRPVAAPPHLPFAPRLGERVVLGGLATRLVSWALARLARRPRRARAPLPLPAGDGPHPHPSAG